MRLTPTVPAMPISSSEFLGVLGLDVAYNLVLIDDREIQPRISECDVQLECGITVLGLRYWAFEAFFQPQLIARRTILDRAEGSNDYN